ncbi:MAG: hypothetical protein RIC35_19055 [Marinoscillum sp.]
MNEKIENYINSEENSRQDFVSCRDKDITKLLRWFSISRLKSFYSNELLPKISETNNQIAKIEADIGNSTVPKETEILNKLLVTQNNRLKKLTSKNLETQNLINIQTNRLSKNRDLGILAFSILISGFSFLYGVQSSTTQAERIQSEVKKSNIESTEQLQVLLKDALEQLKKQERNNELLLIKIDSLKSK